MLPSTGLFKSIACPYFNCGARAVNSGTECHRPYCHFKHVRKEELEQKATQPVAPAPGYTPAPKLMKLRLCDPVSSSGIKKKKSLEYRPDKPELQYTKSSRAKPTAEMYAPVYVPSSAIDLDDCNAELDELTGIMDEQHTEEPDVESNHRQNKTKFNAVDAADLEEKFEPRFSPEEQDEDSKEEQDEEMKDKKDEEAKENQDKKVKDEQDTEVKEQHDEKINEMKCKTLHETAELKDINSNETFKRLEIKIEDEEDEEIECTSRERNKANNNTTQLDLKHTAQEESIGHGIKIEKIETKPKSSTSRSSSTNRKHHHHHHHSERRSSTSSTNSSRHKHKAKVVHDTKNDSKEKSKDEKGKYKCRDVKSISTSLPHASSSSKTNSHKKHLSTGSTSLQQKTKERHSKSSHNKHKSSSKDKHEKDEKKPNDRLATKPTINSNSNSAKAKLLKSNCKEVHLETETQELFATSEEDIMKECEMIYDQLEQQFASLHKKENDAQGAAQMSTSAAAAMKRKTSLDEEEQSTAPSQRKRVAYENADKVCRYTPAVANKPNHVRNAMQAIYNRQTLLRKKQEEDASAAEAALRDAEEKVREANEALRKVKEKNLTPLIPRSFLTPPSKIHSRPIAPVANMLALERAKKKVEALKAEKKPAFTPAKTTKGLGRVAHRATAASTSVEPEKKPSPPVLEATSTKISFNIRMQYYEMMVKHCLSIYPNDADAWERAQTEELAVLKKCNTPVIYKSSALLTINKLRKEAADSGNKPYNSEKLVSHEVILAGKLANSNSWSMPNKTKTDTASGGGGEPFDKLPGDKSYEMIYDLRLTEEQLVSNGYPRAGKRPGTATIAYWKPLRRPNETERYCSRCGKVFSMAMYDEECVDECNYHPKSTGYRRGFIDNQHRCCQQPAGTAGCTYANYHVSDYFDADNLTGYVATIEREDYAPTKKDIYALDCEMCYTTHGIELTRVTVVDVNARTVYDALVKPDNKIVDYNTTYSGITEKMLANETRTLRDIQAILMSMFHSKTILIGHSLESDLKALKIIHSVVVDTSVLFPHKMGPPKKRALKTLCVENLKRIIQENETGHDSAEDAEVCIQLVKFYLRNKIS